MVSGAFKDIGAKPSDSGRHHEVTTDNRHRTGSFFSLSTRHHKHLKTRGGMVLPPHCSPPLSSPPLGFTTHDTHPTRNGVIISNSLLSSSYAQQLLNFGGNFQKILSVSLGEIACPDAP